MTELIRRQVDLAPHNSFAVSARAAWFAEVHDRAQLDEALAHAAGGEMPLLILGGGSNCLFLNDFPGLVLKLVNTGIDWLEAPGLVRAAAGENWHGFVTQCLNKGLHGLENLALIPGTVGAAPIQNIGAYGVELERFFVELEALDLQSGQWLTLDKAACDFAYRDSLFKRTPEPRWLIWTVTLRLAADWEPVTGYGALREALAADDPQHLSSHQQVFDAVCQIRQSKLPDPASLGNAGSFFKNPVVSADKAAALHADYPELPSWPGPEAGLVKLSAAWLLDQAGWKGARRGQAGVHAEHALVLVNHGGASGEDIYRLAQEMSVSVLEKFAIALQPEVRII